MPLKNYCTLSDELLEWVWKMQLDLFSIHVLKKKGWVVRNTVILKTLTMAKLFLHAQGCRGDKFCTLSTEISWLVSTGISSNSQDDFRFYSDFGILHYSSLNYTSKRQDVVLKLICRMRCAEEGLLTGHSSILIWRAPMQDRGTVSLSEWV